MKEIDQLPYLVSKVFADAIPIKAAAGFVAVAIEAVFGDANSQRLCIGLTLALIIDTVTGAVAAGVAGEKISSAKLGRLFIKILGYGSVIAVVRINTLLTTGTSIAIAQSTLAWILGAMIATESLSILENVRKMGISLPFGLDKLISDRLNPPTVWPPTRTAKKKKGEKEETS